MLIEALMFLSGLALGLGAGVLAAIKVLAPEVSKMLVTAGKTTADAQLVPPEFEPEERVSQALQRLLSHGEVEEMTNEVMRIAQDAGRPLTEEQAREEAERILYSGSMLTV